MKNKFRFDFGSGEAAEGFVKVTGNSIYDDKLGYGLQNTAREIVRRKGELPFARNFLVFEENMFRLKLENGTYRIRLFSGDYEDEGDVTTSFYVNGKEIKFWVNDASIMVQESVAEVTDGMLELKAGQGQYICLNALEIAPKLELQRMEVYVDILAKVMEQKVTLSWKAVEEATTYRITRKNLRNGETDIVTNTMNLRWSDSEVELCENFEYTVAPLDEFSCEIAEPVRIRECVADGGKVTGKIEELCASSKEKTVSLKWKSLDEAVYYRVYKKAPLGLSKLIGTTENRCAAEWYPNHLQMGLGKQKAGYHILS